MSEDSIYRRLEELLSGGEPVAPDPGGEPVPPAAPAADPVESIASGTGPAPPSPAPVEGTAAPLSERPPSSAPPRISTMVRTSPTGRATGSLAPARPAIFRRSGATRSSSRFDPREWPLATQLALVIILLVGATVAAATAITTRTVRLTLTEQIGNDFVVQAQGHVDQIKRYFLEKGGQIQTLAFSDVLRRSVEASNAGYTGSETSILADLARRDALWAGGGRADPFILSVISQLQPVNPAAHELHNFARAFPDHAELILTDRYGATVATNRLLTGFSQGDEEWWLRAWNNGQGAVYLSDPRFEEGANVTASVLAVPITGPGGEVIGVLRTTLVLEELYTRLTPATAGSSRHAVLFDARGEVLFDPRADDVNSAELPETDRRQISGFGAHYGFHIDQFGTEFLLGTSQLDKPSGLDTFPNPQTQALADAISALAWAPVVRQDSADAFAGVDAVARNITLVGVVAVIVSTLAGILVARAVNRPLIALTDSASRLGRGDLDVDLSRVRGSREVRQVNRTFETMAGQISELLGGLEDKVAERTRDLELAAEIGRSLSRLRDLDHLLSEAAGRIRARFDLYHTQIYLADSTGRRLLLRAGTGSAGRTLLERRHQLPLGLDSVNGRAAAELRPVIVVDTSTSPFFLANPLLPETRSEMAVPLMIGQRLLGVLDMQSVRPGAFTDENLPAFEALAGQLAVAIENANLFRQNELSRQELEAQARKSSRENWSIYLDAIDHRERLGFSFEDDRIRSRERGERTAGAVLDIPLSVIGAEVGSLIVEDDPERDWSPEEARLVRQVSEQLAEHIENLRLLSEAERFRAQAEAAVKRQTAGGWEGYLGNGSGHIHRFHYDGVQVLPASANGDAGDGSRATLEQALSVFGVPIGELALWLDGKGDQFDAEARELVRAVSDRLSAHIENLRLNDQARRLLTELEATISRLQELDQLKSSFLANMSHELRTPLNSILGFTQVMQEGLDGPLNEQMQTDLEVIRRNGSHLMHLIDDVLDMAKIEAGTMNLERAPVELAEVLAEVLEITAPLAEQKKLQMSVRPLEGDPLQLDADRLRLRQILLNLIGNAIKFTDAGTVTVQASRLGDRVQICVADTGIGIPPENQELIFQAFSQVDTSSTRKAGGTGLGLPISRRLVDLHGGRIWVESDGTPGNGSRFYVEFPA
ncbi:MAG TPA: ATP-binding protein [Anaerolineales bacterium]|nr:ATP-binding protein [Anaerolineales bacterium]